MQEPNNPTVTPKTATPGLGQAPGAQLHGLSGGKAYNNRCFTFACAYRVEAVWTTGSYGAQQWCLAFQEMKYSTLA